jgi:hypothetical protein
MLTMFLNIPLSKSVLALRCILLIDTARTFLFSYILVCIQVTSYSRLYRIRANNKVYIASSVK